MIVVDASAVIKWFLPEQESQTARLLLKGDNKLIAPTCLLSEVAHVLLKKERRGEAESLLAWKAICWIKESQISFISDSEFIVQAVTCASLWRRGVFDCLYLTIAQERGLQIATYDRPMAELATRLRIPLWSPDTPA